MQHSFKYDQNSAVVETQQGKVRGYMEDALTIFKGIPYAHSVRFHAPEKVKPWEGTLDATSYGYVCPLLDLTGRPNGELLVPHRYWVMNEDCQNLNIWTPGCDDGKRPVLVWLHGGGFEAGSAIEHIAYDGASMSQNGQVVVVTINHRLNVLGYFDLSDFGEEYANSGNAGTDDIIAALQWIKENIASFGGDPGNVTVFGQSGGGAKVTTLLQTPAADGLFHKGVNMSGVIGPVLADATGSGKELAEAILQELSLKDVKELETVPYALLAAAYVKLRPSFAAAGKYVGGRPHPNAFYKGTPVENGFRPESEKIPMMIGSVFGEFTSFIPTPYDKGQLSVRDGEAMVKKVLGEEAAEKLLPLFTEAYPERNPVDLLTIDYIFRWPEQEYLRKRSALNTCTYAYLFDEDMPVDGGRTPWHCSDIPFFFRNLDLVPVAAGAENARQLEQQIFESLMAFARTGNPNNDRIPEWPASTSTEEYTMLFGKESKVRTNYDHKLIEAVVQYGAVLGEYMKENAGKIQH